MRRLMPTRDQITPLARPMQRFQGSPCHVLWLAVLIAVLAGVHFYRSAAKAAELEVIPDSVEYAVAAHRFATSGQYRIVANGGLLPSRYPPGFSVLFLAPIYAVAPGQIGNGIIVVWVAGILAALFAYLIGNRLAGAWGGTLAAILLLHHTQFAAYTQVIMTDVPAVTLGLMTCWLYLRMCGNFTSARNGSEASIGETAGSRSHIAQSMERARPRDKCSASAASLREKESASKEHCLRSHSPPHGSIFGFSTRIAEKGERNPPLMVAFSKHAHSSGRLHLLIGVLVALSVSIRPLTGLLLLPFLLDLVWQRRARSWRVLLALCLPTLCILAGTGIYQSLALGDWTRTGYQFWLPVPYDFFPLTFSSRYLKDNLALFQSNLVWIPITAGMLGLLALCKRHVPLPAAFLSFITLTALPLSVVHCFYFFTDIRFHFLGLALMCIAAGAGAATLIPQTLRQRFRLVLPIMALMILVPRIADNPLEEGPPIRYRVATLARRSLPDNAIFISGIDPVYLEQMVARGTKRHIVPIDRETPYAAALIARHHVGKLNPGPHNAADQSCAELIGAGAERLFVNAADEELPRIAQWIRDGVPVYAELLSTAPTQSSRKALQAHFQLRPISPQDSWLVRLTIQ